MKRKSNWLKNLLQWGTLAAIVGFVVYGLTLGEKPADVEAYCPFGGLQALGSYLVNNSLACTMSMTQIMVGVMLAVGVILFSKLFCGYLCPLGTVSEWMGRGGKKLKVSVEIRPGSIADRLLRAVSPLPFVPSGAERDARTEEILMIQSTALLTRMEQVHTQKAVLGVSGGLDSTLTLLAAAYAFRRAGYPMEGLVGITMPGMGTGSRTLQNALKLMQLIGCTTKTIPIGKAVAQHFDDIGQDPEKHDIAYENSQARERTQIIMDVANQIGGLALGTGDLSELALGWCTYNGDQMSMYNMSASVPKTLIQHLVRYAGGRLGGEVVPVVEDILDTPISPELIPSKEGELTQRTEDTLGAYALHDFFLYHMMDSGASPLKLYPMAKAAFNGQYDDLAILAALRTFVRRFFTQQFKRSAMPDGPKVGSVSLSPRGDWRMPSDAQSILWMQEVEQLERLHS